MLVLGVIAAGDACQRLLAKCEMSWSRRYFFGQEIALLFGPRLVRPLFSQADMAVHLHMPVPAVYQMPIHWVQSAVKPPWLTSACPLQFLALYCTAGIAASLAHVGWFWYRAVREGALSNVVCRT